LLDGKVQAEQVVLSHSPLRMFRQFLDKHVLVSGQGPVESIAAALGYTNVTSIDKLRQCFPLLDAVDHQRRKAAVVLLSVYCSLNTNIEIAGCTATCHHFAQNL